MTHPLPTLKQIIRQGQWHLDDVRNPDDTFDFEAHPGSSSPQLLLSLASEALALISL